MSIEPRPAITDDAEAAMRLHLRCHGAAFLWVLEDNPRAQAFYARNSFGADGARDVLGADWHNLPEIRRVRPAVAG